MKLAYFALVLTLATSSVANAQHWSSEEDKARWIARYKEFAKENRTLEELQKGFDANKSKLYNLPGAAEVSGKVIVALTIEPDGSASNCEIVSSSIWDSEFEKKIISTIESFNFGAREVKATRFPQYPIHFRAK